MSVEIRARVRRARLLGAIRPGHWSASVVARDELGAIIRGKQGETESWPEAMQAAHKLRADLERELMDEVHASRASRRYKAACTEFPVTKPCDCQECDDARAFVEATA